MEYLVTDLLTSTGDIADPYRSFIAKSRYSRWLEEENRRETWTETVDRYMSFMLWQLADKHAYVPDSEVVEEVRSAILHHEVMPSMRAVMTAGEALERSNIAGFNCFRGSEEYITRDGLRTFADTLGTTQTVLNAKGQWTEATIESFGEQRMSEIVFRPGGIRSKTAIRHRVVATPDHRWITENRGEVTDLRPGDMVKFVGNAEFDVIPEAFIQGFGFGDGTLDNRGRARVRLCGAKDQQWLGVFEEYGHCSIMSPPSFNGDVLVVFHQGYFSDWKNLPDERTKSAAWLASWLEGYLAADGHRADHQPGLSSQNSAAIEFAKRIAPLAGYAVTGHNISTKLDTNLGTRKNALQRLTLRRETTFRVMEVNDLDVTEEVFCAVVPEGHEFVLANGIHTGNCSYLPLQDPRALDELLYILMNGTGVGYSVERHYTEQLPAVPDEIVENGEVIHVADSKEGWGYAFRALLDCLWRGVQPTWNLSQIRPAGARLRTFGGRASGPGPLDELFEFTVNKFHGALGRQFRPIEVHDIACKIASVVVVGGVRRSAMISLSDLDDQEMAAAKSGEWWKDHGYRALANNSAVYYDGMSREEFDGEWDSLVASGSGERGIFHRGAARRQAAKYGLRDPRVDYGTNPCSEIILRPFSFCNLSETVVRPSDSLDDLHRKVRVAAILGTWQSTLTDFPYLRDEWRQNAEEERLLGSSLTGIYGNRWTNGSNGKGLTDLTLASLRLTSRMANEEEAARVGIPSSAAISCNKPSGTVSQLVDCESGLHTKHARFYKRRVRVDKKDPIAMVLIDAGLPHEEDSYNSAAWVFTFVQRAAEGALVREDVSAIEHLELWLAYQRHWCEHKPSVTISVRDHEWGEVGAWVWEHLDEISGVSFLPYSDHTYVQAPYEEISREEYEELAAKKYRVDWEDLALYETYDQTKGSQTLACTAAGGCEDVDLVTA